MMRVCLAMCLLLINYASGMAQEPTPKSVMPQTPAPPDLTEGLLDLLKEPDDKSKPSTVPASPEKNSVLPPSADQGEDIGQTPEHPLKPVQQSMAQLADWLRSGTERQKTQQLQRDVVLRLDDLIEQIEQQQSQNKSQSSSASSSSQSASEASNAGQRTGEAAGAKSGKRIGNNESDSTDAGQASPTGKSTSEGNQPGQPAGDQQTGSAGKSQSGESQPGTSPLGNRKVLIDLNDPTALQRSAWGNLPERMREQMQSRMVERFLPGYREDIEAYYRALAK